MIEAQPKKPLATAFTNSGNDSTSRPPKSARSASENTMQDTDAATIAFIGSA